MTRSAALLYINGTRHEIAGEAALSPLTDYLRYTLRLTGTKVVCAEGDCGACTVLVARFMNDADPGFIPVNACITTPALCDGAHIITVEALQERDKPHPVQTSMLQNHGAQCGFCTPGIVCALAGLFERTSGVTEQSVKNALTGNLCRCTGYEPILNAALEVGGDLTGALKRRYLGDPVRNSELGDRVNDDIFIEAEHASYFAPVLLDRLLRYKRNNPDARLISAATDIGVAANKREGWRQKFCSLSRIPECHALDEDGDFVTIGAGVTLTQLQAFVKDIFPEFHDLLKIFASPQIRNVATLAGNIANASPIADTLPFLCVMNAAVEIRSCAQTRLVNINDFYHGYKKMDLRADEIITAILIPKPRRDERLKLYKVSRRKDLDISCVTAGFLLRLEEKKCVEARVAYGGVGPTVLRLLKTETFLKGRDLTPPVFEQAGTLAQTEGSPIGDVRGSRDYRLKLVKNLFLKLGHETFVGDEC